MTKQNPAQDSVIQFLRKRDYTLVRELGEGACGKTVLLHDTQIDEDFVCKKYAPYDEAHRQTLFTGFVREIKLLHRIHHQNVVRVFNYYLFPDAYTGYILMEFVSGAEVDDYLKEFPEKTNEVFLQTITGFAYLERSGILHRDIRTANIMVRDDGTVKIIDLGFGKEVRDSKDFKKSISLNWWCEPPAEFAESRYDFRTEAYFVGKLFQKIIQENEISHFKYSDVLARMCQKSASARINGFAQVEKEISNSQFFEIDFDASERETYRQFAAALCSQISKVANGAKYIDDIKRIQQSLNDAYRSFMLEEFVPDAAVVTRCFIDGAYYYSSRGLPVHHVREFLRLLKASTEEKKRIILANLHTKLDAIKRYTNADEPDDVPF